MFGMIVMSQEVTQMSSFSYFVGQRIKKYRKSRGYTIEQFSAMINKSKATLSKYENGAITIDIETLYDIAQALDIDLKAGVYMYFPGPQFETPAEVRAARVLGADAVGMSTVPEAIAAAHCGYEILGVTLCANMAAGVLPQPLSGEEVNEMAEQSAPHFSSLILGCLERL